MNSYFNEHAEFRYDLAFYICDHCFKYYSFDNADELREHVLEYHSVDIKFNISKMQIRDLNHAQHAEEHVYNYASSTSFDYITMQATVFDYDLSFCIDFDETVSLLNKSVLFKNNLSDIIHNALFITIIDVTNRQIFNQITNIEIELNFNKISLKMIAYLVKRLSSEFIIINDVLSRFDVNFQYDKNIIKIKSQEMFLLYSNADFDNVLYHYIVTIMRFDQHINKITKK